MGLKLDTIFAGLIWSLLFGTAGGILFGGLALGSLGFVGTAMMGEFNPVVYFAGFVYLGMLGAILGALLGFASEAIGWLPSVLFPDYPRMSYFAAVLLGMTVGLFAYYCHAADSPIMDEYWLGNAALLLLTSIFSSLASNFVLRRWLVDVPFDA